MWWRQNEPKIDDRSIFKMRIALVSFAFMLGMIVGTNDRDAAMKDRDRAVREAKSATAALDNCERGYVRN